jgi:hypothetical protein
MELNALYDNEHIECYLCWVNDSAYDPSVIYERQFCAKSAQLGINDCFEAGKFRCWRKSAVR